MAFLLNFQAQGVSG